MNTNDIKLKFSLTLEDNKKNTPVKVENEILFDAILEPAMLGDAYKQIEQTLQLLGVEYFLKRTRAFILNKQESNYEVQSSMLLQQRSSNDIENIKVLEVLDTEKTEQSDNVTDKEIEETLGEKTLEVEE